MSVTVPPQAPPPRIPLMPEAIPFRTDEDSFDFQRSWAGLVHACRVHWLLILVTCALTVGIAVFYTRFWPPVFVAEVTLAGESNQDRSRENFYSLWAVFRGGQLTDEAQQIVAGPVLEETIRRLDLGPDEVYRSFFSHIGYVWTNSTLGKTYRRWKEWLFPPTRHPYQPTEEEIRVGRLLNDLRSGVALNRVMETNIGRLAVKGPTPRVAEIANTIVDVYMEIRRQRQVQEADSALAALSIELDKAREEVAAVEEQMRQYFTANQLLLTFERDKLDVGQLSAIRAAIAELRAGIAANEAALEQLNGELAQEARDVVGSRVTAVNPVRDSLRERLVQLQIQRQQTRLNYRSDSPEMKTLDQQIAIIERQLAAEPETLVRQTTTLLSSRFEEFRGRAAQLRAELAAQRASLAAKVRTEAELATALSTLPDKMRMVASMDRERLAAERKQSAIQERLMMATVSRATAATASPPVRIVERAAAPAEASWPKTKLLLAGAVAVGLLAGVLLALVMDLFFARVHRFRLASVGAPSVYAVVQRDRGYVQELFAPTRPGRRQPGGGR